jgi:hypothetical protein
LLGLCVGGLSAVAEQLGAIYGGAAYIGLVVFSAGIFQRLNVAITALGIRSLEPTLSYYVADVRQRYLNV